MTDLSAQNPTKRLSLCATVEQVDMIDRAAMRQGKSRSQYILDAAYEQAIHDLFERTHFVVDGETFDQILTLIDDPPQPSSELIALMQTKRPWE